MALNEYFSGIAALFLNAELVSVNAAASTVFDPVSDPTAAPATTIAITPIFQLLLIVRLLFYFPSCRNLSNRSSSVNGHRGTSGASAPKSESHGPRPRLATG